MTNDELKVEIDKVDKKVDQGFHLLNQSMINLNNKFGELAAWQSELNNVKESQQSQEQYLTSIQSKVGTQDSRVTALETKMDDVNWLKKTVLGAFIALIIGAIWAGAISNSKDDAMITQMKAQGKVLTKIAEALDDSSGNSSNKG